MATPEKRKSTHFEKRTWKWVRTLLKVHLRRSLSRYAVSAQYMARPYVPPDMLSELAALPRDAGLRSVYKTKAAIVVKQALNQFVSRMEAVHVLDWAVEGVLTDLRKDALVNDLQFRLPPPDKEPDVKQTVVRPLTLVERRAIMVNDRLANWERKLKLAKTKVAALKKRQSYYRRKGVV